MEVLLPDMQMLPRPVIHPLISRPDQQIHLVRPRIPSDPLLEEVSQQMCLLLKVQIQEHLRDDTLGVTDQDFVAVPQLPVLEVDVSSGDGFKIRYVEVRFDLVVLSAVFVSPGCLEVCSKFLRQRGFADRFWSHKGDLLDEVRLGCVTDHVPISEGLLPDLERRNRYLLPLDVYVPVADVELLSQGFAIFFGGEDHIQVFGCVVSDHPAPNLPELGVLMRV